MNNKKMLDINALIIYDNDDVEKMLYFYYVEDIDLMSSNLYRFTITLDVFKTYQKRVIENEFEYIRCPQYINYTNSIENYEDPLIQSLATKRQYTPLYHRLVIKSSGSGLNTYEMVRNRVWLYYYIKLSSNDLTNTLFLNAFEGKDYYIVMIDDKDTGLKRELNKLGNNIMKIVKSPFSPFWNDNYWNTVNNLSHMTDNDYLQLYVNDSSKTTTSYIFNNDLSISYFSSQQTLSNLTLPERLYSILEDSTYWNNNTTQIFFINNDNGLNEPLYFKTGLNNYHEYLKLSDNREQTYLFNNLNPCIKFMKGEELSCKVAIQGRDDTYNHLKIKGKIFHSLRETEEHIFLDTVNNENKIENYVSRVAFEESISVDNYSDYLYNNDSLLKYQEKKRKYSVAKNIGAGVIGLGASIATGNVRKYLFSL